MSRDFLEFIILCVIQNKIRSSAIFNDKGNLTNSFKNKGGDRNF